MDARGGAIGAVDDLTAKPPQLPSDGFAIARHASPTTVQIDPFKMMTNPTQLPPEHFADYSFVFN